MLQLVATDGFSACLFPFSRYSLLQRIFSYVLRCKANMRTIRRPARHKN